MRRRVSLILVLVSLAVAAAGPLAPAAATEGGRDHLRKAKLFLAAGDYRRAFLACQREVDEAPSAASYVYVTYILQAIDGYLEHLAATDRWIQVEHLYLNLVGQGAQDLTDPPDVLVRIAKEIIQESTRKQSDITAAMAARLDEQQVARLWKQQTAWRKERPESWWAGVPPEWGW